jgi:uncharacterized protein (TIGR00251 family)
MAEHDFVKGDGSGCVISIDASPGSPTTEVAGVNRWRKSLHVRISAEAKDGAANEELVRFLSELLSVPRRDVTVIRGQRSTRKLVRVPGDPEIIASKLMEGL